VQVQVRINYLRGSQTLVSGSVPPTFPDIQRTTQIKILKITLTNRLSISEHVHDVNVGI